IHASGNGCVRGRRFKEVTGQPMAISRREFIAGTAAAPLAIHAQNRPERPKLAAVVTTDHRMSHAQHIVDRFLDGYGWNGTHHHPAMDLVGLYVNQGGS